MDSGGYLPMFVAGCRENLEQLHAVVPRLAQRPRDREAVDAVFRLVHSLKGMGATMGLEAMTRLAHELEGALEPGRTGPGVEPDAVDAILDCLDALSREVDGLARGGVERLDPEPLIARLRGREAHAAGVPAPAAAADLPPAGPVARPACATVPVDVTRLDHLAQLAVALRGDRERLEAAAAAAPVPGLAAALDDLGRTVAALEAAVTAATAMRLDAVLSQLARLVRDASRRLGKEVDLTLRGGEVEIDVSAVDTIANVLVHLVRNSLDHGLEAPDERRAAGKATTGSIDVSAFREGGDVLIAVRDDGRGIDRALVAANAARRGLVPPEDVASIDMDEAIGLLFVPGFSTAGEVTELSGRGVGLDAAKAMVEALGGELSLSSEPGSGTTVVVRCPSRRAAVGTDPGSLAAAA